MKNQYFGDTRDLFKYDIIQHLYTELSPIERILFIPMLTPDDTLNHGKKIDYSKAKAGYLNIELVKYLSNCILQNKRNIKNIINYFDVKGLNFHLYKPSDYLLQKSRDDYFRYLNNAILPHTLIFIDPDNGLEIKNPDSKHLLITELNKIFVQIDEYSILMIYQHFPRVNRKKYIATQLDRLKKITLYLSYITDNQILFLFLTKKSSLKNALQSSLLAYTKNYTQLLWGNDIDEYKYTPLFKGRKIE